MPSARASGFLATLKGQGRSLSLQKERSRGDGHDDRKLQRRPRRSRSGTKTGTVLRRELRDHPRLDRVSRGGAQIGIQILGAGLQDTVVDTGIAAALGEPVFRIIARGVVVAKHV